MKLVVFDLDGTLIDSSADLASAVNATLTELGLPRRSLDEVRSFIGEGARRFVERSVGRPELTDGALAMFLEHYARGLVVETRAYPGIGGVVEALARRGPVAVATNKPGRFSRRILAELGLLEHFVAVLGGDEAPRKPDPALVERLRGLVGAGAGETTLVGDSRVDLETARNAGVAFVGVAWGIGSGELPGELVRAPGELVDRL